jgi:hypothetical protein
MRTAGPNDEELDLYGEINISDSMNIMVAMLRSSRRFVVIAYVD